jgi:SAM-dependent methyltransferase
MTLEARRYWDGKATQAAFTHPLRLDWLAEIPKRARLLDYGCGYGRTLSELHEAGWRNSVGVDLSPAMIERGRRERPRLDLRLVEGPSVSEPDGAFEAAFLFAVLTTIPDETGQIAAMTEVRRLLAPSGWLYLSDYLLQDDERSLARYRAGELRHGVRGVWDREDGGVFRHHTRAELEGLLRGFHIVAEQKVETTTFSGARAVAIQVLATRAPDGRQSRA